MPRSIPLLVALFVVLAACTGGPGGQPSGSETPSGSPTVLPVPVSSELAVGQNRFMFSFLDQSGNRPVAAPDRSAEVQFEGPDGATAQVGDVRFVWAIENERGVYVTQVDFPTAGEWTARFTTSAPGSPTETIPFTLTVKEERSVVGVGEAAPSVDTPTADDVGGNLSLLSTDPDPEPSFYDTSVADALAAGEPFVLAFATPKFCTTAQCGPTLDRLKPVADAHPGITFINVEPFELEEQDGQLQPVLTNGQLTPVEAVTAYGLLTEPYIFVVDGDGIVRASYEAIFAPAEIEEALADLG